MYVCMEQAIHKTKGTFNFSTENYSTYLIAYL